MDAKKLQGKGKAGKADKALVNIQKFYGIESRLKGKSAESRKVDRNACQADTGLAI
jgi:transposase